MLLYSQLKGGKEKIRVSRVKQGRNLNFSKCLAHSQQVSGHLCIQANQTVVSVCLSTPLHIPQGCFKIPESIQTQSLEILSQAWIFVGEEVEQTPGHMFLSMYYLKTFSSPCPTSPQCYPFWVNTKTKQRALLSSLEKKIYWKPQQLCLNNPCTSEYSTLPISISPVCS